MSARVLSTSRRNVRRRAKYATTAEERYGGLVSEALLSIIRADVEATSQASVARRLAIEPSTVSRWMSGQLAPSAESIDAIAAAYGPISVVRRRALHDPAPASPHPEEAVPVIDPAPPAESRHDPVRDRPEDAA